MKCVGMERKCWSRVYGSLILDDSFPPQPATRLEFSWPLLRKRAKIKLRRTESGLSPRVRAACWHIPEKGTREERERELNLRGAWGVIRRTLYAQREATLTTVSLGTAIIPEAHSLFISNELYMF